jgi:hypothetical protein
MLFVLSQILISLPLLGQALLVTSISAVSSFDLQSFNRFLYRLSLQYHYFFSKFGLDI